MLSTWQQCITVFNSSQFCTSVSKEQRFHSWNMEVAFSKKGLRPTRDLNWQLSLYWYYIIACWVKINGMLGKNHKSTKYSFFAFILKFKTVVFFSTPFKTHCKKSWPRLSSVSYIVRYIPKWLITVSLITNNLYKQHGKTRLWENHVKSKYLRHWALWIVDQKD